MPLTDDFVNSTNQTDVHAAHHNDMATLLNKLSPPVFSRYVGGAQSITGGSFQRVAWTIGSAPPGFSTATVGTGTVFTCTVAGVYHLGAFARINAGSGAIDRALTIAHGTTTTQTYAFSGAEASGAFSATVGCEMAFEIGDTFAVWCYSASTLSLDTGYGAPWVTIRLVG
jgi:hypothetical protein